MLTSLNKLINAYIYILKCLYRALHLYIWALFMTPAVAAAVAVAAASRVMTSRKGWSFPKYDVRRLRSAAIAAAELNQPQQPQDALLPKLAPQKCGALRIIYAFTYLFCHKYIFTHGFACLIGIYALVLKSCYECINTN